MNARAMQELLGREGLLAVRTGGTDGGDFRYEKPILHCPINVLDAKQAYGRTRVLVRPVNGQGTAWVDL